MTVWPAVPDALLMQPVGQIGQEGPVTVRKPGPKPPAVPQRRSNRRVVRAGRLVAAEP